MLYLQQQNKKQPDKADTLKLKNKTLCTKMYRTSQLSQTHLTER